MDKNLIKQALIEMLQNGELILRIEGDSYYESVDFIIEIKGEDGKQLYLDCSSAYT